MISIETETLLTLREAAKSLPNRPHISTVHRWRLRGVRGVKLETCLLGGSRVTSREALTRFSHAITKAVDGEHSPAVDQEVVEAELNSLGL